MPFITRFQYQQTAQTPVESGIEDRWHQPWSEPVRQKIAGALAIALMVSGLSAPTYTPVPPPPSTTTSSSQVVFTSHLIYQAHTEPVFVPAEIISLDKWFESWSEPVRFSINKQHAVALGAPATVGPVLYGEPAEITTASSPVIFQKTFQYQTYTIGWIAVEFVTLDRWFEPWTEPVRILPSLPPGEQQVEAFTPPQIAAPTPALITTLSSQVVFSSYLIYQSKAEPAFTPRVDQFIDKWGFPWSEPVRVKIDPQLAAALASSGPIGPVLNPDTQISQDFESRWHFPWSEPVRFRRLPVSEYPITTADTRTPEFVTPDKWIYAWSEPVRFRVFPTSEQQAYAAPTYTPEFVTTDKWIYPWSEPVRQKIWLKSYLQQAAIGPVLNPDTQISHNYESRWHYAWSEPVRIKPQVPAGEQSFLIQGPVKTPEFITVDKWIYGWSEPVWQKIGLKTHLQQAYIAPVLNPETQIIHGYESRWHFPWSEPVRVKRPFLTAQQQSVAYQSAFFETINIDKWGFAWSEPVRQKIGLKANLQQAFIGLTLNPETQIIQGYESRWHQAWSEPVRVKLALRAGLQQTQVQGPVQTPEFITVDKWIYPWTDPVRQKIGIRSALQQAFIAPVLADEQLTGTIESRWHQPWSEPVRFRQFATAEQQSVAAPASAVFETVTVDKWTYPWSEPVRQKIGLKSNLQQAFIGLTLEPNSQIIQTYESRWHQPWSEPVRFRRFATAEQQAYAASIFVSETVSVDKWFRSIAEPVRVKQRLHESLQKFAAPEPVPFVAFFDATSSQVVFKSWLLYQSHTEPVASPEIIILPVEARWHQPWSEPVRFKLRLREGLQQSIAFVDIERFLQSNEARWHQTWSEPLRSKPGLGAWLQRPTTPETPVEPFAITRLMQWFAPLNDPVRLKIGFWSQLQREFTTDPYPLPNPFTFWLDATEVNSDSALFGFTVYNAVPVVSRVPTVVVSIKEIPAIDRSAVSIEEEPAIDNASVSIEET